MNDVTPFQIDPKYFSVLNPELSLQQAIYHRQEQMISFQFDYANKNNHSYVSFDFGYNPSEGTLIPDALCIPHDITETQTRTLKQNMTEIAQNQTICDVVRNSLRQ